MSNCCPQELVKLAGKGWNTTVLVLTLLITIPCALGAEKKDDSTKSRDSKSVDTATNVERALEQHTRIKLEILEDIDDLLESVEEYKNAAAMSLLIIEIIKQYPLVDLLLIENRLRKLESSHYLIAAPFEMAGNVVSGDIDQVCIKHISPLKELPAPKYWLWVQVDGERKARERLRIFEIRNFEENHSRLLDTGVLATDCQREQDEGNDSDLTPRDSF